MRFPLVLPRALPALCLLATTALAQSPLTTFYTGGNGLPGDTAVYCNLTVHVPVSIQQLDVNAFGGQGSSAIELWTVPTTWVGNDTNPAAWTLRGSSAAVTAAPEGTPTVAPLTAPVVLAAGSYGLAIVYRGTFGPCYTNGNGSNQTFTRAELTLNCGASGGIFTGAINNPRVWNGSIHYTTAVSGTVALRNSTGTGCVGVAASAYELFATAPAFDLQNSGFSLTAANGGYTTSTLQVAYAPPTIAAQVLPLGDDGQTSVTLAAPFPFPGGTTSTLTICSNGSVWAAPGNDDDFEPNVATMLNGNTQAGWYSWHDYNPSATGSGRVKFEQVGGIAYVTWDGVYNFGGTTSADANTFQFQFDTATGQVVIAWLGMSANPHVGIFPEGEPHLVGYSPGATSLDIGSQPFATSLPILTSAVEGAAMSLTAAPAPLSTASTGSTVVYTTADIDEFAPGAGVYVALNILSIGQLNPGVDLGFLGAPGCRAFVASLDFMQNMVGATPTNTVSLTLPAGLPSGVTIYGQSIALVAPGSLNAFGLTTSNGVTSTISIW